ncbi:SCO7613 C-terminal domain-containing membrane protein [Thalassobacillus sp. CUG 92003]|uniref:SCO7613 C-terminal domain-containing membrane protein n=1 Tax=Thalassobacillus sp. CUG 92003 TaxID=2736641 RepID=UPI0015E6689D|nr:hypothetical protein [Thalassobacillus sp. CUG 92003]
MTSKKGSERNEIFRSELKRLQQADYITDGEYDHISSVYQTYVMDQLAIKEEVQRERIKEEAEKSSEPSREPVKKVKKQRSPEQIRERNITWSLILGVVLLLIGGLTVATSSWEQMGPVSKVVSIFFVAVFFIGLSGITSNVLKIEKTAFAFLTLGSLLIPIAFVALGYFELLGRYLSLTGEGRYMLGVLGTVASLPLYIRNACKHASRLFVWISFLFLTLTIGFAIGAIGVPVDSFYLLLMLFNGGLLFGYHRLKHEKWLELFINELPLYAQLNLIVSTLLMLLFYQTELFFGFNLLLTSAIYMAMVYVYQTKEYQFVFSALFVYGIYEVVHFSPLSSVDLVLYAAVGVVFIGFSLLDQNDGFVDRMFRYMSGAVSLLAFIFVSYQGLLLRAGEDSGLLLVAYVVVAGNFIYLATITYEKVFRYLAPLFLLAAGFQSWNVLHEPIDLDVYMFLYSAGLFISVGLKLNYTFLAAVKSSTYYLSLAACFISTGSAIYLSDTYNSATLLALLGGVLYLVHTYYRTYWDKQLAEWGIPISWLLALLALSPELIGMNGRWEHITLATYLAVSGIALLAVSIGWYYLREQALSNATFYIGQCTYVYSMLLLFSIAPEIEIIRSALLFTGIGVLVWLVYRTKMNIFWLAVAFTLLAFYVSLLSPLQFETTQSVLYYLYGSIIVLMGSVIGPGKIIPGLKPYFFWIGHSVQLIWLAVFFLTQFISQASHPAILAGPLLIYVLSSGKAKRMWQTYAFLYAGLALVPFIVAVLLQFYTVFAPVPEAYVWLISSILMTTVWFWVGPSWQRRMTFFTIPFSLYGLYAFIITHNAFEMVDILPVLLFIVLNLFLLHKRQWTIINVIPLLAMLAAFEQLRPQLEPFVLFSMNLTVGVLLLIGGLVAGARLYNVTDQKFVQLDWYALSGLLYICYTFTFVTPDMSAWYNVLICIAMAIWFGTNRKRTPHLIVQHTLSTFTVLSVLSAYYVLLEAYIQYVPALLEAEAVALPVIGVTIALSLWTWRAHPRITGYVQLVILLCVAAYLVSDAIESHTVWDAIIIGFLSLVSMVSGMQHRIKSYFFVGMGVLIFNVMYQTNPYWGNMPWWVYLLIAGSALISVASYNEWRKQKGEDSQSKLESKVKGWLRSFRNWN